MATIVELTEDIIMKSVDEWITTMEEEDPKPEDKDLDPKLDDDDDEDVILRDIIAKFVNAVCMMEEGSGSVVVLAPSETFVSTEQGGVLQQAGERREGHCYTGLE